MIRRRHFLLTACAPLALRHTFVDGCMPHAGRGTPAKRTLAARMAPTSASARVVRLFAVQLR
jgi:hypothetical protein